MSLCWCQSSFQSAPPCTRVSDSGAAGDRALAAAPVFARREEFQLVTSETLSNHRNLVENSVAVGAADSRSVPGNGLLALFARSLDAGLTLLGLGEGRDGSTVDRSRGGKRVDAVGGAAPVF